MRLFPSFPEDDFRHHRVALDVAIRRVPDGGHCLVGEEVAAFEAAFAAFAGARRVMGVASGTGAIELMLRTWEIGCGAKVVVPSLTAKATAAGEAAKRFA